MHIREQNGVPQEPTVILLDEAGPVGVHAITEPMPPMSLFTLVLLQTGFESKQLTYEWKLKKEMA